MINMDNRSMIPTNNKYVLELLLKGICRRDILNIKRSPSESLIMIEHNCFIVYHNKDSIYSIEFYSCTPVMNVHVPRINIQQYFNEPGFNIQDLLKYLK